MSRPTLAAAGVQAYGLLTLLDRKEESRVRALALTYERLEAYRREYPLRSR
jgi:hypothetical protein